MLELSSSSPEISRGPGELSCSNLRMLVGEGSGDSASTESHPFFASLYVSAGIE